MSFWEVLKESYKRIFTSPFKLLGLGFIIIVATLFGVLTPTAFNIMPDSMETFPIAIVNEDEGTIQDGERVNYGDDIMDTVEDNDDVNWEVQESGYFDKGINNTKYFAAFVIPKDFSKNVVSAKDGTPQKADIIFLSDIRKSYIFSQFSKSIKTQMIDMVGQNVSEEYVAGTFDSLYEIKDELTEAADGSQQVTDGAGKLKKGANDLKDGVKKVDSGAKKLEEGSSQLSAGANKLNDAVQGINVPSVELTEAQKQQIQQQAASSEQVLGAATMMTQSVGQGVSTTVNSIKAKLTDPDAKKDATQKITAGVLEDKNVKALIALAVSTGQMDEATAKTIVGGIVSNSVNNTLDGAAAKISADEIAAEFTDTLGPQLKGGIQQVAGGAAVSGGEAVASAVNQQLGQSLSSLGDLKKGTKDLAEGADSLEANMGTLTDGTSKLVNGSKKLADGAGDLQDGSNELTEGLSDGVEEIDDSLVNSSEAMGEFVAEPVVDKTEIYGELTRYSQGFFPLFIGIGLWVGTLLLFFVVPVRPRRDELVNAPKTVASGILTALLFGLMEATLIFAGGSIIGIAPAHPLWLYLFLCFVSLAFVTIIYMLCVTFGLAGKLIAVLFTVFQIPCCAGSFPVQLMPTFFQKLNPFLPMTYAIDGVREALSGTEISGIYHNCGMLGIFMAVSLVIALLACKHTKARTEMIEAKIAE